MKDRSKNNRLNSYINVHHRKAIRKAWFNFVNDRPAPDGSIRSEIMESWKRCRDYGVNPYLKSIPEILSKNERDQLISRNNILIKVYRENIKILVDCIKIMDFFIALLDKDGYILDMIGKGPIWSYCTQNIKTVVGCTAQESYLGTNVASIALQLDKPYEMVAEESYIQAFHPGISVAAPIHDANRIVNGCLAMVLSLETSLIHTHALAMITAFAGIIENQVQIIHSAEENDFLIRSLKSVMACMNEGVVIISKNDTIYHINIMAEKLFGIKLDDVVNQNVKNIIKNKTLHHAINNREQLTDQEIILDESPNKPRCLISSSPITSAKKEYLGSNLVFKEIKFAQDIINKNIRLKAHYTFDDIRGESQEIKEVIRVSRVMANSNSNVVIIGESGTGKEMIAQGIHNAGSSAQEPFVAINCAAIPYNLIESEFFGYEPGTFTGGLQKGKPGKLELVRGGTLFLDEINGMSIDMQAKLLRVLEEKKFQRLGSNKYVPLDARVVSATNQDLLEQVKHGTFRHDLYYRLSVVEIHIPPLRMRMKDIEILVHCFIEEKNRQLGRSIKGISKEAMEYLMSYHWPGNIRELRNWIERAINLVHGNILSVQDFPTPTKCIDIQRVSQFLDLKGREKEVSRLGLMEYNTIRTVLEDCKGNISQASKRLGISRATLYRKMRKYGIVVSLNVLS